MNAVTMGVEGPASYEEIAAFYRSVGYDSALERDAVVVAARQAGEVVGVVRLVMEEGVMVLRGMEIAATHQKQGLGTRMLQVLDGKIGGRACYCLPYPWLGGFYGQIGFEEVKDETTLPPHLRARLADYRARFEHPPLVMKREQREA